jgi:hypothetical protein
MTQGPIYNQVEDLNNEEKRLKKFFNKEVLYGTVLNWYVVQPITGYPLNINGSG